MERTLIISGHRNRVPNRIRNPSNRSRFTMNHYIRPFLKKIRITHGFKSNKDLIQWLRSDEVFPCWQEFRRDCYQKLPAIVTKVKFANPMTRRLEQRAFRRRAMVSPQVVRVLLMNERLFKNLQQTSNCKSKWPTFNYHVAWFIARVYGKVWDAKRGDGSLSPLAK